MAGTTLGAQKRRAAKFGVTLEQLHQLDAQGARWCSGHKEFHDKSLFTADKSRIGGLRTECTQYRIEWREDHPEKVKPHRERDLARSRAHYRRNRERVTEYLRTHPCVDCGESDTLVLDFDHRDRSIKYKNISQLIGNSWTTIETEIAKCDVRCANDHRRRTAKQLGYGSTSSLTDLGPHVHSQDLARPDHGVRELV